MRWAGRLAGGGATLAIDVQGGLALVVVLSYRAFAFWLPTIPGALAYLRLRHSVRDWAGAPHGKAP